LLGLVAVVWSVDLLYKKLKAEAAVDPAVKAILDAGSLWTNVVTIAAGIGQKIAAIPPSATCWRAVDAARLCRARLVRPHRAEST